jgi:acetoacetate decarboxylase
MAYKPYQPGVPIMPTSAEALRKAREGYVAALKAGTVNPSEHFFQGSVSAHDAETSVVVRFLSDPGQIESMLPAGKNLAVDDPPVVTVVAVYQGGLRWLAGLTYNLLLVILPVVHSGKAGKTHAGFLPVVWENMTEPIIMGRELLGWPKIYADLPPARKLHDTWQSIAAWNGFTFLDINLTGLHVPDEAELKQMEADGQQASAGMICHKYISRTGATNFETDADYLTLATNEGAPAPVMRELLTGRADIRFNHCTWEQVPTMHHIINKLAALPVKEVYRGIILTQTGGGMGAVKILE